MLLPYGDTSVCAAPMAAHELFIIAEALTQTRQAEGTKANGDSCKENL